MRRWNRKDSRPEVVSLVSYGFEGKTGLTYLVPSDEEGDQLESDIL
jgi:hypothetical protein